MSKEGAVGITVLVHPPELDERTIRRALARGLQVEGWQPTLPHEIAIAAPAKDAGDLLAELLKLRSEQLTIPSNLLLLDDPEAVENLKGLVYKPAQQGGRR